MKNAELAKTKNEEATIEYNRLKQRKPLSQRDKKTEEQYETVVTVYRAFKKSSFRQTFIKNALDNNFDVSSVA